MKSKSSEALSILKQALMVNRKPVPWGKAFSAGLAASLPVVIGLLFGHLDYGLIAGLGGFTYLYVFPIPYAQLAKKLFWVVIGLTLVTILGTLSAPYPLAVAILMGVIGATVLFIFGTLRIAGPSAIFFVLVFAMVSGMPVDPGLAPLRATLVFLGGCLSIVIAMIGWLFNPYSAEESIIKRVYIELAKLIDSVGTPRFNETRHNMMSVLREADETLTAGYIPWRKTDLFKRLYLLNQSANNLFMYIIEHFADSQEKLPQELGQTVRELAKSFDQKNKAVYKKILQPDQMDDAVKQLFEKVYDADAIMNEPTTKIDKVIRPSTMSLKMIFGGALDKNSIVFITALRFGIITIIAAIIAFELELVRSYWVPLSCVAVMAGSTLVATHHRAIQRGIGTMIGILIASVILALEPSGYVIALFILILTFITELFIVKNYGLAALFFTPNALLMAESTSAGDFSFSYFASARMMDVVIGSLIGLIGVWIAGRKSASSRIPHLIEKTIRSQAQLLVVLFSEQGTGFHPRESKELRKMRINLTNLKTLYTTAMGEIPVQRKTLDYYWPIVFSIEHLAYLLEECSKAESRPILSDQVLSQLLYACELMANSASLKRSSTPKIIPTIEGYPTLTKELRLLQNAIYC